MTEIIHVILNLIEAFIFPFFIANYFNFKNKKAFIIIVSIIQFIILNIFYFLFTSNIILTITIIISMLFSIYIFTNKITFNNIFITILYNCLIYLAALSVLLINNVLTTMFDIWFKTNIDFFLLSCLLSRIILIIITMLILKKKLNFSVTFDFKYWGYIIILELLLLTSIGLITYSLTFNEINNTILSAILVFLIIIAVLFKLNLYHLNELNKVNLNIEKNKQLEKFNFQKLNTIKNVKNEIDALNHRMFYVYYNIELLLKNKKYQEAYKLLQSYRNHSTKYDILIDTQNIIFDCLFSLKINDLIANGLDVNLCIFISKSPFYDSLSFINSLNTLMECFHKCSSLTVNITEKANFTIIKIYYPNNINIEQSKIINATKNLSKSFKSRYEFGGAIKDSIKISIKREDSNEV